MNNILLFGALGKMGREIVKSSSNFKDINIFKVVDKVVNSDTGRSYSEITGINWSGDGLLDDNDKHLFENIDCVIEFTNHKATVCHLKLAKDKGIPYIIGTTGFDREEYEVIENISKCIPVFISSNMSRGINIVNYVLEKIAPMLEDYNAEIWELHHKNKKDSPSGTAIMLANTIKNSINSVREIITGRSGVNAVRTENEIGISSIRAGDIFGEHHILFADEGENIEIIHRATNRAVFANGTLNIVGFIMEKERGLYTYKDLLCVE
jgi:4-hydroxy-tetrahydrodipicolinate reductase